MQLGLPVEGSGVIAKKLVGFGPSEYLIEKADCKELLWGERRRCLLVGVEYDAHSAFVGYHYYA